MESNSSFISFQTGQFVPFNAHQVKPKNANNIKDNKASKRTQKLGFFGPVSFKKGPWNTISKQHPARTNFKRGKMAHPAVDKTNEKSSNYKRSYPYMFPYMSPYMSSYYAQNTGAYGTPYPNYYNMMTGIDKKDYVNDNDVNSDYEMSDGEPVYQYPLSAVGYPKLQQRSQQLQRRRVKLSDYGYLNNEDIIAKAKNKQHQAVFFAKRKNNKNFEMEMDAGNDAREFETGPYQVTNHMIEGELEKHGEKIVEGL